MSCTTGPNGANAVETTTVEPRVTTRALVDPSRKCSLRCAFCYYLPDDDLHTVQDWESQKEQVLAARRRGADCCDISGGEPMQNPHVVELVRFCAENGLPPRIISSLICPEKTLDAVLDAGVDDWLISMHGGDAETHNAIVNVPKARQLQIRRLSKIAARMRYCANYVMVEKNQTQMADWARWLTTLDHAPPKVVNFINFNVFGPWLQSSEWKERGKANIVDLRICGPILDEAIDVLEEAGVGVNVRYYPMCGLAERHRKNVCNDLHVAFDQGEWDNAFGATTPIDVVYHMYSLPLSKRNEEKGEPCNGCSHQWICGGAGKIWHRLALEKFGEERLTQIELPEGASRRDYWYYRAANVLGVDPRRQGAFAPSASATHQG